MRRLLVVLVTMTMLWGTSSAQAAMSIPPDIKKTVCFIFVEKNGKEVPNGTGFFVSTQKPDGSIQHVYLVTAKHVLQSSPEREAFYAHCSIRLSQKSGGVKKIPIALNPNGKRQNIFCSSDPTVDIAVIPFLPAQELYDFKVLPSSFLAGKADFASLNVREGSDVFFVGMFTGHLGEQRNQPIMRFGKVALLSDERVYFQKKMRNLYLLETFSFGGNSGSPVFVYLGADRNRGNLTVGNPVIKLAGVMSGTFQSGSEVIDVSTRTAEVSLDNMGIAAVAPCYLLQEILLCDELKNARGY